MGRGRGKDIADLGKLKLDQMGAPQPIVWITSVPFLSEHKNPGCAGWHAGWRTGRPAPHGDVLTSRRALGEWPLSQSK